MMIKYYFLHSFLHKIHFLGKYNYQKSSIFIHTIYTNLYEMVNYCFVVAIIKLPTVYLIITQIGEHTNVNFYITIQSVLGKLNK